MNIRLLKAKPLPGDQSDLPAGDYVARESAHKAGAVWVHPPQWKSTMEVQLDAAEFEVIEK